MFVGCIICALILGYRSGQNPLIFAQTQSVQTVDLKIKGNRKSRIYHLPKCPNHNDIAEQNIVWFKTHAEARAAGYRMAKNCF